MSQLVFLQSNQCRLTGKIFDSTGAVAESALITVLNDATGVANHTRSNEVGVYVFPYLAPGAYSIQAEAAGFEKYTVTA